MHRMLAPRSSSDRRPTAVRSVWAAAALSALSLLTGCATNPVSGKSELSLISEQQEV